MVETRAMRTNELARREMVTRHLARVHVPAFRIVSQLRDHFIAAVEQCYASIPPRSPENQYKANSCTLEKVGY